MAPTATSLSCPANDGAQFTTPNSQIFNIKCFTDYAGGDMGVTQTTTFEDCMTSCATTTNCVDVAYVSPNCYMKSLVTSPQSNGAVWGAILASAETAANNRISCVNNKSDGTVYTAPSGAQFTIECGVDYFGGDMGNLYAETMEICLDACDDASGCVDVAYAGKYCYLKHSLEPGQSNGGVWGARKLSSDAAVTSTTTTTVIAVSLAMLSKMRENCG